MFSLWHQSMQTQQTLPPVSYTKAIDVWLATCVVFVFLRSSVGSKTIYNAILMIDIGKQAFSIFPGKLKQRMQNVHIITFQLHLIENLLLSLMEFAVINALLDFPKTRTRYFSDFSLS